MIARFHVNLVPGADFALVISALGSLPPERLAEILGNLVIDGDLRPAGSANEFDLSVRPNLTDGDRGFLSTIRAWNFEHGHSTASPGASQ